MYVCVIPKYQISKIMILSFNHQHILFQTFMTFNLKWNKRRWLTEWQLRSFFIFTALFHIEWKRKVTEAVTQHFCFSQKKEMNYFFDTLEFFLHEFLSFIHFKVIPRELAEHSGFDVFMFWWTDSDRDVNSTGQLVSHWRQKRL